MIRLVIADEDKAHEAFIRAYESQPEIQRELRRIGQKRVRGTVHAEVDSLDCPDGLPNCRNCGDPKFTESCAAAGHCPHCGTRHGVAPDSVLLNNGYVIEET